jgi:hypothetical protein
MIAKAICAPILEWSDYARFKQLEYLEAADRILALPEIANGLQLLAAHKDALFDGTGLVRITRLAAEDVRIDPPA